jgi:non-ribosomal peptide synthetase component F
LIENDRRMVSHFKDTVEDMSVNRISTYRISIFLADTERARILHTWNQTQMKFEPACIQQLFEAQALRNPEKTAVVFEVAQLTYQELNWRANRLAHYLQNLGVKPDTLVGIYMERSPEMIVGLLGILKAGGAYVPLDPRPADRLSSCCPNSGRSC